jgi:hypothetical protein
MEQMSDMLQDHTHGMLHSLMFCMPWRASTKAFDHSPLLCRLPFVSSHECLVYVFARMYFLSSDLMNMGNSICHGCSPASGKVSLELMILIDVHLAFEESVDEFLNNSLLDYGSEI